jgi:hypothetical protein
LSLVVPPWPFMSLPIPPHLSSSLLVPSFPLIAPHTSLLVSPKPSFSPPAS